VTIHENGTTFDAKLQANIVPTRDIPDFAIIFNRLIKFKLYKKDGDFGAFFPENRDGKLLTI